MHDKTKNVSLQNNILASLTIAKKGNYDCHEKHIEQLYTVNKRIILMNVLKNWHFIHSHFLEIRQSSQLEQTAKRCLSINCGFIPTKFWEPTGLSFFGTISYIYSDMCIIIFYKSNF